MPAMGLPPPRGDTMVGILIDDFISLSLTPEKEDSQPSKAAALADEMQQAYQDVKLLPNHKKAFRDQEISSFWGRMSTAEEERSEEHWGELYRYQPFVWKLQR